MSVKISIQDAERLEHVFQLHLTELKKAEAAFDGGIAEALRQSHESDTAVIGRLQDAIDRAEDES